VQDTPRLGLNEDVLHPILVTMRMILKGIVVLIKIPLYFLDHLTAHRKSQITSALCLDSISPDLPILIYVHYSKSCELSNREINTLNNIRKAGFQICVVVNKEKSQLLGKVQSNAANELDYCLKIIRKNIGWDLGAYRDAFYLLKKNNKIQNQPIIFMNNSVIWFPDKIENYFNNLIMEQTDVIAASISNQYRPHIQTFLFGSLNSNGTIQIESWLRSIKNWRLKRTVVSYGELGTNRILKSQIVTQSFPDFRSVQELGIKKLHEDFASDGITPYVVIKRLLRNRNFLQAGVPINPSHDYWLELFESGFPGIKVDLVRSNPLAIADYEVAVSKLLESKYDYKMITELLSTNRSASIVYKIRRLTKW
jgi:hypothetical protein